MKSIIITGGNSGLGYTCAHSIAKSSNDNQIILACRDAKKAKIAVDSLIEKTGNQSISTLELDLASLDSVRNFVHQFSTSNYPPLYALVCNAGLILMDKTHYTVDGFESTFGVNHLGHFLLISLLLEKISDQGRILLVSSGTHDPANKTIVAVPEYENAELLAHPQECNEDRIKAGQRRYSTSKLCNIYCAYELAERITKRSDKNISVNVFDPGQMPGTGFSRTFPPLMKFIFTHILPLLSVLNPKADSAIKSGESLSKLVLDPDFSGISGKYFKGTKEVNSSELSYDKKNRTDLWNTSVKLTRLTPDETLLN